MLMIVSSLAGAAVFAQGSTASYSIGAVVSRAAYLRALETSEATGLGLDIKREQRFGHRFAWTVAAGFNYFTGDYTYLKFNTQQHFTTINHQANIPVLGGVKYYFGGGFYASGEVGLLVGADGNTGTHPAVAPSAGYLFAGKHKIDAGIKLVNVIEGFGIPENNGLQNGGYGFWSVRVAVEL